MYFWGVSKAYLGDDDSTGFMSARNGVLARVSRGDVRFQVFAAGFQVVCWRVPEERNRRRISKMLNSFTGNIGDIRRK